MITLIVAMTRAGVIGRGGGLPWRISGDLGHFMRTTMGHAVVMGRKTYESIGKPLPGRATIVMSRTREPMLGIQICTDLEQALTAARSHGGEIFVAGGADVYRQALPVADRLLISFVRGSFEGDTTFPEVDWSEWSIETTQEHPEFEVVAYRRIDGGATV